MKQLLLPLRVRTEYTFLQSTLKLHDYIEFLNKNNYKKAVISELNNFYSLWKFYDLLKHYQNLKPLIGVQLSPLSTDSGIIVYISDFKKREYIFSLVSYIKTKNKFPLELIDRYESFRNYRGTFYYIALNTIYLKMLIKNVRFKENIFFGITEKDIYYSHLSLKYKNRFLKVLRNLKCNEIKPIFVKSWFYPDNEQYEFIHFINSIKYKKDKNYNFSNSFEINSLKYYPEYLKPTMKKQFTKDFLNSIGFNTLYDREIKSFIFESIENTEKFVDKLYTDNFSPSKQEFPVFYKTNNIKFSINFSRYYKTNQMINYSLTSRKRIIKKKKKLKNLKNKDCEVLKSITLKKLRIKMINNKWNSKYFRKLRKRLLYELSIIAKMNFCSYFLFVKKLIDYSRLNNYSYIVRGSAASSIVSFLLGFTSINPVEYNLYFERFLNPLRSNFPDIDIDFSWKTRDIMLNVASILSEKFSLRYVRRVLQRYNLNLDENCFKKKFYSSNHYAMIGTILHYNLKGALRALGRYLGFAENTISEITKIFPSYILTDGNNLKKFFQKEIFLVNNKNFKVKLKENKFFKLLLTNTDYFDMIKKIINLPITTGVHAGGFCISGINNKIYSYSPVEISTKGVYITQFDMYSIENTGLVKIDILSQRGLGVIENIEMNIGSIDFNKIYSDKYIWNMIKTGDTIGCFYIESPAMRGLLKELNCNNFNLLIIASSVIRPGVSSSGMKDKFIYYHKNQDKVEYIIPQLKDILKETYGIMIFQEDVMKVTIEIGKFSMAEADILRKGMSGKTRSREQMKKLYNKFISNGVKNGFSLKALKTLWFQIESFAGYSFCKAHSAVYATLSVKQAYYKRYYTEYFYAEVINNLGGYYPTEFYLYVARFKNIRISPPILNHSRIETGVEIDKYGKFIKIGLKHYSFLNEKDIKHLTKVIIETPAQIITDINLPFNKFAKLVYTGFFRYFKYPLYFFIILKKLYDENKISYIEIKDLFKKNKIKNKKSDWFKKLYYQKKYSGFYIEVLPMDIIKFLCKNLENLVVEDLEIINELISFKSKKFIGDFSVSAAKYQNKKITIIGYFIIGRRATTYNGKMMGFATFIDFKGVFEATFFPESYDKYFKYLKYYKFFKLTGTPKQYNGLWILEVESLEPILEKTFKKLYSIEIIEKDELN